MSKIDLLFSICSIIIPVFATIYTVNNRIKNSNRENHQPYLILDKLETLNSIDIYKYYLTIIGKYYYENTKAMGDKKSTTLNISMCINNIGYGVATNIKFYDLFTGKQIEGSLERINDKDQKLFTTLDMASSEQKKIQSNIISLIKDTKGNIIEDNSRILCVYQDLHNNVYSFIISIIIKNEEHYDFFAYQPSSRSYKKMIRENKKEYNTIIKKYSEL